MGATALFSERAVSAERDEQGGKMSFHKRGVGRINNFFKIILKKGFS